MTAQVHLNIARLKSCITIIRCIPRLLQQTIIEIIKNSEKILKLLKHQRLTLKYPPNQKQNNEINRVRRVQNELFKPKMSMRIYNNRS